MTDKAGLAQVQGRHHPILHAACHVHCENLDRIISVFAAAAVSTDNTTDVELLVTFLLGSPQGNE